MSSERAGTPTHGALNREQALPEVVAWYEQARRIGYVAPHLLLDALEACVVQDPRITRIEALLDDLERAYPDPAPYDVAGTVIDRLHAALEPVSE